jgi:sec-independent protein translocase protein TatB
MMKRVSFSETIFLFVLALIVFGPKKLPEIARQIGKVMNEFRRASNEFKSQIEQEIAHLEVEKIKPATTIFPPSSPPEGTASRTLSAGSELGPAPIVPSALSAAAETTPTAPDVFGDEPLFANTTANSTEPSPAASENATSPASQESHA